MSEQIDIFISYSHRDSGIAKDLVSRIEDAGLHCFIAEKDISAGELREPRIRKSIIEAKRILLLITPRSKNSLWVAAEAGAAWALKKELIACLLFVEPNELIYIIRRHQARRIESQEEVESLINELLPTTSQLSKELTGQWIDPIDGDTVYFLQKGNRVVGFYDYGTGKKKVGLYIGLINNSIFEYHWSWLERDIAGKGRMILSSDKKSISGKWWHVENPEDTENVQYHLVSNDMPKWVTEKDFEEHRNFLKTGVLENLS